MASLLLSLLHAIHGTSWSHLKPFLYAIFISENKQSHLRDMMVTFKVDADARAKVQGSEDQEKYPIVAKVKGTGKDGALSVQVSGEAQNPISARVSGDSQNPIAIDPIEVAPITIIPDLRAFHRRSILVLSSALSPDCPRG